MEQSEFAKVKTCIKQLHRTINELRTIYSKKKFTLDGRLVGDIGEMIAETFFDLTIYAPQQPIYDGETPDGKKVQIKATFKEKLTFNHEVDYYLGIQLDNEGNWNVVYNGKGEHLKTKFGHLKGFGTKLLSFPIKDLLEINATIPESERIKLRSNVNGDF